MLPAHKARVMGTTQPWDFGKGHDGLAALVQSVLKEDPFTGTVFVFRDGPFVRASVGAPLVREPTGDGASTMVNAGGSAEDPVLGR